MINDPINAADIVCTSNPFTKYPTNQNKNAFIKNPKSPKVTIFIGNARICNNGFKVILIIANTIPAMSATVNEFTVIPATMYEITINAVALPSSFKINLIIKNNYKLYV